MSFNNDINKSPPCATVPLQSHVRKVVAQNLDQHVSAQERDCLAAAGDCTAADQQPRVPIAATIQQWEARVAKAVCSEYDGRKVNGVNHSKIAGPKGDVIKRVGNPVSGYLGRDTHGDYGLWLKAVARGHVQAQSHTHVRKNNVDLRMVGAEATGGGHCARGGLGRSIPALRSASRYRGGLAVQAVGIKTVSKRGGSSGARNRETMTLHRETGVANEAASPRGRTPVTMVKPFTLRGEAKHIEARKALAERKERQPQAEVLRRPFRARPMPDFPKPTPRPRGWSL